MILENSGIDYSQMLLFVLSFLVYWRIEPNSRASGNTWPRLDYKPVTSKLLENQNVTLKTTIFKVLLQ